jgi:hypothetical protein
MQAATHQTVKLSRGSHASPGHGACVMELASMLAGERFSDHPSSVSPVIASVLRAYNDLLGDERRQDLYRYAASAVGTRAPRAVEEARLARTASWAAATRAHRAPWSLLPSGLRRLGLGVRGRHDSAGEMLQRAVRARPATPTPACWR